LASPYARYESRPLVTRVDTYRIPSHIVNNYRAAYPSVYRSRLPYSQADGGPYGVSRSHRGSYGERDYYTLGRHGHDRARATDQTESDCRR
jgi:hypothetical protein